MYLRKLSLLNFKNYEQAELSFSQRINCFVGNNGAGKSNLLDAIYYLSFCKGYFNQVDARNIRFDKDFMMATGNFNRNNDEETIYCGVKKNQKKIFKRNDKIYKKLSEHIGLIPLVVITPLDTVLVAGGSEERRKFTDTLISQFNKTYLKHLIKYNRALLQRNKLLKSYLKSGHFDAEILEIWNQQLVLHGNVIYSIRQAVIDEFIPVFQRFYKYISNQNEEVSLQYSSRLEKNDFEDLLKESLEKDRILTYTTTGIHKDDLSLELNGFPIKKIGSQGQQKTFLVALKLAEFELLKSKISNNPILLLDDIFDKLDFNRVQYIVDIIANDDFGQIFITDTNQKRLADILSNHSVNYKLFNINSGIISEKV